METDELYVGKKDKVCSYLGDSEKGLRVVFFQEPKDNSPTYDHILIEIWGKEDIHRTWIHEEEALSLVSGLSQALVEVCIRKPLRKEVEMEYSKKEAK